jgi:hypothetical protein
VTVNQINPVYYRSVVASSPRVTVFGEVLVSCIWEIPGKALRAAISAFSRISLASEGVGGVRGGVIIPFGQRASRAALRAVVMDFSWNTWIRSCRESKLHKCTSGLTFGRRSLLDHE